MACCWEPIFAAVEENAREAVTLNVMGVGSCCLEEVRRTGVMVRVTTLLRRIMRDYRRKGQLDSWLMYIYSRCHKLTTVAAGCLAGSEEVVPVGPGDSMATGVIERHRREAIQWWPTC